MLATSKDVLLMTLALCIFLFTLFTCWGIYYVVVMLKNFSKMTTSVREKLEVVDKILKLVQEKLEHGSNHIAIIADSVIKLVGFFMEKQGTVSAKRKKK